MPAPDRPLTPWLTVAEAATRARVGRKTIYREIAAGRLRAAVVGGRRDFRLLDAWVDEWLMQSSEPAEILRPLREARH
ncbi:MAG: helix-turn-helix domain-containing protein [Acidobacteriota bacterium]|nr:helix-turn-helix domain-containing protein [Acidobacteriota bacterium]